MSAREPGYPCSCKNPVWAGSLPACLGGDHSGQGQETKKGPQTEEHTLPHQWSQPVPRPSASSKVPLTV